MRPTFGVGSGGYPDAPPARGRPAARARPACWPARTRSREAEDARWYVNRWGTILQSAGPLRRLRDGDVRRGHQLSDGPRPVEKPEAGAGRWTGGAGWSRWPAARVRISIWGDSSAHQLLEVLARKPGALPGATALMALTETAQRCSSKVLTALNGRQD